MNSVMVTGGAGFTGRHIIDQLADEGHRVVSYDRDFRTAPRPDVRVAQGELFDVPRLLHVIAEHEVDTIVHTAAVSHPTYSLSFPVATFAANTEGTVAVFEAARLRGVRRIVNFSSQTVYGPNSSELIDEDQPVAPSTPYAITKAASEWLGRVYSARFGVDVVSLRIAQVYGPGNTMDEVVREVMQGVVRTGSFSLPRGADHHYNLVYALDVALAASAAVTAADVSGQRPLAYNVSSAEYWSLAGVLAQVQELFPGAALDVGPGRDPVLDLQGRFCTDLASAELGHTSQWPLARALPDYAAWLAENQD